MARMRRPVVPEKPVPRPQRGPAGPIASDVAGRRDFIGRRDHAILSLMIDTGLRRSEVVGLSLEDLDLDVQTVVVLGKGRRLRIVSFGAKTAATLDRYLRERGKHRQAALPALWLGERNRGPLTTWGLGQMLERRAVEAGIGHLHPHMLRHTMAANWIADGGAERT